MKNHATTLNYLVNIYIMQHMVKSFL